MAAASWNVSFNETFRKPGNWLVEGTMYCCQIVGTAYAAITNPTRTTRPPMTLATTSAAWFEPVRVGGVAVG